MIIRNPIRLGDNCADILARMHVRRRNKERSKDDLIPYPAIPAACFLMGLREIIDGGGRGRGGGGGG